jgi:FkbM family methyltransferase
MRNKIITYEGHHFIPEYFTGNTIIDAGACKGVIIEELRSRGINSLIIAIEPCKTNLEIIRAKNFTNVKLLSKALVGNNQSSILFTEIEDMPGWGSVNDFNSHHINARNRKQEKYIVETVHLADLCIDTIDWLKIDIEGSESEVISELSLETAKKIRQISIELHNKDFPNIQRKLRSLGYKVFNDIGKDPGWDIYGIRDEI